jgi:sterol desaturase/sphingolipid hydroxylase (fatty acid hydroxylase superfamily)
MVSVRQELSVSAAMGVLTGWAALTHLAYSRQAQKEKKVVQLELAKGATPVDYDRSTVLLKQNRTSIMEHPVACWFVENGMVWFSAFTRMKLFGPAVDAHARSARWVNVLRSLAGTIFSERLLLLSQYIVVHSSLFYGHIQPFNKGESHTTSKWALTDYVSEWLHTSVSSEMILSSLVWLVRPQPNVVQPRWSLRAELRTFSPLAFCAKLAVVRVVSDLLFWLGHYCIHQKGLYIPIHKRHHEHHHPHVLTNQHFTIVDLFIEAYLPLVFGLATLVAAGVRVSPFESSLLAGHISWLEACSHSGKPMPCSSLLAPLSPLYNEWLGFDWDRRNVEFHHSHHQILKCNYSITQWPDHLFGTTKWYPNKQAPPTDSTSTTKDQQLVSS